MIYLTYLIRPRCVLLYLWSRQKAIQVTSGVLSTYYKSRPDLPPGRRQSPVRNRVPHVP